MTGIIVTVCNSRQAVTTCRRLIGIIHSSRERETRNVEVFLDDAAVDASMLPPGTVEETLRHLQSRCCGPEQMVIRVRCDGHDVEGESLSGMLRRDTSSLARLEVYTGTRCDLVQDAMTQAAASLSATEAECHRAAELLTRGDASEGILALGECLRVWQQIHEAVGKSIQILQLDVENTRIGDDALADLIRRPRDVLVQVKEALQARDHVLLADVLEYELGEVTARWHRLIERLLGEATEFDERRGPVT